MISSRLRVSIILILLSSSLLLSLIPYVSAGTPVNLGWIDHSFGSSVNNPAAEKPQSKLWYNDSLWWGALYVPSASAFTIHRFDWASDTWTNTGVVIDAREDSRSDTLWDGTKLYIISHGSSVTASEDSAQVRRYSYNSVSKSYSLDAGFPVTVSTGGMEAAVIAKDSTNILWITFTQNSGFVYVSHSNASGTTWVRPYVLPFSSQADAQTDDISSIIAFGGNKIGVMWSNQNTDAFYFAVHQDGAADNVWTLETALQGAHIADDHINLKTDSTGRVYAAVKTSVGDNSAAAPNESLNRLLVRQSNGTWTWYNFGRLSENHTRPMVLIDEATRSIYMFATLPTGSSTQGEIRFKKTSMDNIAFPEGIGTRFIYSSSHQYINNVSSTKQNISCASGVLVIADDNAKNFYFHNKGPCGLGSVIQPTPTATAVASASPTPSASSNRIKNITFEDGSLTHPVTGADKVSGTVSLETSNPLKGSYSVRIAPLNASPYLEENFTAANDFYLSFYIKLDSYPTSDLRLVLISNSGTTVANIQLRPSGRLRLRNGSTTIGAESSVLTLGQLYRIGIQQSKGSGSNAVLRAYLASNDNAFASPFAQSTTGTWTTAANRVRLGATTAGTFNLLLDDIRLDSTVMPSASSSNIAPTISNVSDQTTSMNASTAIVLNLDDAETAAENLLLSASSSDQSVVPDANILLAGSGAERTVTVIPATNQAGDTTITLSVSDGVTNTSDNFTLTVTNAVPTISDLTDQTIAANSTTSALAFVIGDAETAAENLLLSASSSDQSLVPDTNIVFAGSGSNRTVTITAASNQTGTASITLTVSDGFTTNSDTFVLTVLPPPNNTPPTIDDITDQTTTVNSSTTALAFTIGDAEMAADSLVLSAVSSNPDLVPISNILFGGLGANRTVTISPATNQSGAATIGLIVSDGSDTSMDTFILTVTNSVPRISDVTDQTTSVNGSALAFTIGDAETAAENLLLNASSSNTSLVPNANIVLAGSGANRTVSVIPALNQTGTAIITLTVSDGSLSVSDSFVLSVNLGAATTSLTFTPTDDALVRSDKATSNYGALNYLRLRGTDLVYISYLKFDLTGLSGTVRSARLRLYSYDGSNEGGSVYLVSNNYLGSNTPWTEAGLTWNNAPAISGSPVVTSQTAAVSNSWVAYDLTSLITGNGSYSFGLSINGSNSLYFSSKEAIINQPVLEIIFDSGSSNPSAPSISPLETTATATTVPPQFTAMPTELVMPSETASPEATSTVVPTMEPTAIPTEVPLVPTEAATGIPEEEEESTEVATEAGT